MKHVIKRAAILFGIFAVALIVYIAGGQKKRMQGTAVYTAMEEARLPVVYVNMFGRDMNPMYGYRQDMGNAVARESLTILPEDRKLPVMIEGASDRILAIRYEIRSLDLQRLVENTALESWDEQENGLRAVLPIQNLLTKERQYLLRLELDTESMGTVYYYTRIVWSEDQTAQSMIDLAVDFSSRTFDYEQAKELVTYLETNDTEDNSSFGHATIRSSFAHLTWGRLKVQPLGRVQVTLRELDGIMGCVSLSYMVSRQDEGEETEYYQVEEDFTMKWNELRTYLMDYERTADQVFMGNRSDFAGKRIMLGITNDGRVGMKYSSNGQIAAFRANRDLWSYNQKERQAIRVFSFHSAGEEDVRSSRSQHDIRILKVDDSGDIDFLVYGYQNRGNHEGQSGIVGYRYDESENALQEKFFIPVTCSYEELEADLEQLSYRSQTDMLYLYLDHAIYGIDLESNENMVVADALEEGSLAISTDKARVAWQEDGRLYDAHVINLLDLETGEKKEIRGAEGDYMRTLGFVGRDLVYGIAREGGLWMMNGRIKDFPMYAVEIVNDAMQIETRYEKEGYYVAGASVEGSRIHLNRVIRSGYQNYAEAEQDTIVCNMDMGPGELDGIGWYASQDKGKLYFVQLGQEIRGSRNVRVSAPKRISYDQAGLLELKSNFQLQGLRYYAYGGGHLQGVTTDLTKAVSLAYDRMGIVTDQDQRILWSRVNRGAVRNIKDPSTAFAAIERHLPDITGSRTFSDGVTVLDARGCTMTQMLYFIDRGIPVMGYTGEGTYLLLCGFDQYNVTVYDPQTREIYKAGLNDSTEYFRVRGNDFICAVEMP